MELVEGDELRLALEVQEPRQAHHPGEVAH